MAGKKSDFDAEALAQTTAQQGKDISGLGDRVNALEAKLTHPDQLAAVLETAAGDSKKLDQLFSRLFCDMLKRDEDVKAAVTQHVTRIDRNAVMSFFKKWSSVMGAGALYVLGLVTKVLLDWLIAAVRH